ncbi:hypothetical protein M885DRAFT_612760, partial [Pelagophyceae sp. CCMP2097]
MTRRSKGSGWTGLSGDQIDAQNEKAIEQALFANAAAAHKEEEMRKDRARQFPVLQCAQELPERENSLRETSKGVEDDGAAEDTTESTEAKIAQEGGSEAVAFSQRGADERADGRADGGTLSEAVAASQRGADERVDDGADVGTLSEAVAAPQRGAEKRADEGVDGGTLSEA